MPQPRCANVREQIVDVNDVRRECAQSLRGVGTATRCDAYGRLQGIKPRPLLSIRVTAQKENLMTRSLKRGHLILDDVILPTRLGRRVEAVDHGYAHTG
jgi:hypothetical protein